MRLEGVKKRENIKTHRVLKKKLRTKVKHPFKLTAFSGHTMFQKAFYISQHTFLMRSAGLKKKKK